ncbi:glycosyltransferase [Dellaglioa algida]|uniref:glycosyltransferase n=1 Tax=Dellaglioa algida TaxID=105612 RepID=UPI0024C4D7DE|nr:glycosyltransferase [Dellaglioa algida]MDK1725892.1 glycosyltransferase [Dellaglioa algida]
MREVAVLLATYNGEKYIEEQLKSILDQDFKNFTLFIRDDGSNDGTLDILSKYLNEDKRIKLISDEHSNTGQLRNFSALMDYATKYSYVFFSDQDDIWNENKISVSLSELKKKENISQGPLLLFTNYKNFFSDSNEEVQVYNDKNKFYTKNLFVQNWIMGCTVVINQELLIASLNIPQNAENHDNWIANVAATVGKVHYTDVVTMKHRIHENNVTTRIGYREKRLDFVKKYYKNRYIYLNRRMGVLDELNKRFYDNHLYTNNKGFKEYRILMEKYGKSAVFYSWIKKFKGFSKKQTLLFYMILMSKKKS